ncbi:MAG: sulfate ABC transporter substrate-binding protein [Candidatus Methylacidiphilales bacterium]
MRRLGIALLAFAFAILPARAADEPKDILNASFDVARELYTDIGAAFMKSYKEKNGVEIIVNKSFGGSSKQAKSIVDGVAADIATMNQETDITFLVDNGLVNKDWRTRLPDNAAPFSSTIVFLVRKGNPKGIKDWADLIKPKVELIVPNPKTSGNGRYTYLAAYAYALKANKDVDPKETDAKAKEFVSALFKNVVVMDTGGRAATTTFTNRTVGDVLLSFENELLFITKTQSPGEYEVVYPSISIQAELPVAVVDKIVDGRGSRKLATAYADYLWSEDAQRIGVKYFYRPRNAKVIEESKDLFGNIPLAKIDDVFGGWTKAFKTHFDKGGYFDQIFIEKK